MLSADRACRETLAGFLSWLPLGEKRASARTAGYCKARARLPQADLDRVHAGLARRVRSAHLGRGLWLGRAVKVADGSGLSMPDTPSNQKRYPQSKRLKKGCAFPVMRVTALFCLATGVLIGLAKGPLSVGEGALFRTLWGLLEAGDVLLADRGFCSFCEICSLVKRGVDAVLRNHPRRTVGVTVLKRLGRRDHWVLWHKPRTRPDWVSPADWDAVPATLTLRRIRFRAAVKAFRTREVTVVTTLLDPKAFPTKSFPELYRRRWQAELFLRDIKITTGMDILRCKTPDMLHRELTMHLIGYNLVRLTMLEAARDHDVPAERISFKGALSLLRSWAPRFSGEGPDDPRALWSRLLDYLAGDPLPNRPNRVEPRARKRRPKNYQLLTQPRHEFKEIPHRSHYRKA